MGKKSYEIRIYTTTHMDFELSEEHKILQSEVRKFAQNEIVPVAPKYDASGEFPMETIKKMGEMGLMGIEVPEEYGGAGMDTLAYVIVMEEIAAADAAHSTIVSVNNSLYNHAIMKYGTEEQKKKYVVPVATGEVIGAYALTEPQSGSDAGNIKTKAELSDDGEYYVINGRKSWITSGPVAKYIILFAQTQPELKHKGVTAFIIDTEKEGFIRGKTEPKLGIRASATCEIAFNNYKVPIEDRLGEEGQGFKIAMSVLDAGRIGIAAQSVGIARAAYEASVQYSKERYAFGQPIGKFQMIQQKIADMKTRIEASRLLVYNAAWKKMQSKKTGERYTLEASMAKLFASETAMFVAHQAVQIHGGMGYSKELPIERYFRDAKITEIYEGTSEIQRYVIARLETGLK